MVGMNLAGLGVTMHGLAWLGVAVQGLARLCVNWNGQHCFLTWLG